MSKLRIALSGTFTQEEPAQEWIVEHNRGYNPIVTTMLEIEGKWEIVLAAAVEYTDLNTFKVSWTRPRTGKVRYV